MMTAENCFVHEKGNNELHASSALGGLSKSTESTICP
jgi:hypothetical protein